MFVFINLTRVSVCEFMNMTSIVVLNFEANKNVDSENYYASYALKLFFNMNYFATKMLKKNFFFGLKYTSSLLKYKKL